MKKRLILFSLVLMVSIALAVSGCGSANTGSPRGIIIDAKEAAGLIGQDGVVLVDMQTSYEYQENHIKGAVNIAREDITVNQPVPNMLAPKEKIEEVLGRNGIKNSSTVIIYDNTGNMDAARLWWTLMGYGHEKIKVVSGGLNALKGAGLTLTGEETKISLAVYTAQPFNSGILASMDEVKAQVYNPQKSVVILDTRTIEEYDEGRIPGAVLLDFNENNFPDGTYKPVQHIKIQYLEKGVKPDKTIIMYCKTSIRATQTALALYDAGYTNLKIYDGAWLEWSGNSANPVEKPSGSKVEPSQKDMS